MIMNKKSQKGFTLVELMVVIVIIGILAALAIPRFLGASDKAKAAEFKPVLKQIYTLQEAYFTERDLYGGLNLIAFDAPAGGTARFSYTNVPAASATAGTFTATATLITALRTVAANETATINQASTHGGSPALVAMSAW